MIPITTSPHSSFLQSKGASEKRKLTQYVTNTVLDSLIRGTSQQFVLHFNEQFRRLDELTDLPQRIPESIKMGLLQNAVNNIPQLSIVETLDEYTCTTSGVGTCTHTLTTTFSSMLVLGMMQLLFPLPLREGMYIQLLVPKLSIILRNPTRHISLRILTHHQMISIRCTKPNKANHHLHPYLRFRGIPPEANTLYTQETPKKYDGPVYVPAEVC